MHTGDLAVMDEDGYVNIVGRVKDMIIRGGENVYPREIEEFLYQHPAIQDVQVIGVPDERYGEQLLASIILKPGETATEEELRDFCDDQDRLLQDPALLAVRRQLPDDDHRQGPEIPDAGGRRSRISIWRRPPPSRPPDGLPVVQQQRPKTSLDEVPVGRQRLGDPALLHHDEGDAVDESQVLSVC